ncbi:16S rRNA (cytidine(1402)-2'-O)-methyltransferase [Candidatus Woesebacteria bacterium RIFCSPHIGHO2_01_FULL_38_10]|uniref:Ribosomal RNA small subunit methyltransferase I n=1 Tax=Candidatus Woesebacteria bacterium RIFCSPLOWO2_01_FULL_39_10b TaxID=1802517 RepID=A0A1F8BA49_9BACT|nr:MAG: 16S rRNA (cytidine(1402)-2'-O)-methyltransferase [Candidatus Woesebacteria bacterium RIFCSPHIGHO2_01_FULL_38_10]OGM60549.1 MAG: 16S rRNA (cytidine(1402)-2'-O)-methyltransferase [Candidatus Woesebacteria bacterium RIFCSPLOWO2_01_FULL_39_10b]
MTGFLYIVATPIGNLEDITLRALRILKEIDLILVEDSRVTKKLLMHYGINKSILTYHQHSPISVKNRIVSELSSGKNLALVSDAGTPGISDPGNELIDFVLQSLPDAKIIPIPGASAISASLSVCGLNVNKFVFLGFLPKKKRKKLFAWFKEGNLSTGSRRGIAFAFYESPKRILKTLDFLQEEFGSDKKVFIARELTKLHESLYRGTIEKVRNILEKERIRGEIVVVVD